MFLSNAPQTNFLLATLPREALRSNAGMINCVDFTAAGMMRYNHCAPKKKGERV
jgi:hypothetical protein